MQTVATASAAQGRFWNETPFRSYLFNAFSLLLPSGEQFVIRAMQDAAVHLPEGSALHQAVAGFVREEQAHQRAHRQYNIQLAQQGYSAAVLEARAERAVDDLERALHWRDRLALAAALEYLTAQVSHQALRGGWLVQDPSREARLWRWHCQEELAHHGVALQLLRAVGQVGYLRRMGLYGLASLILLGDVARHIADFARTDRARGWLARGDGVLSLAGFVARHGLSLVRMAGGWLAYGLPLRWLAPRPAPHRAGAGGVEVRLLRVEDIEQLLILERRKWDDAQAASAQAMAQRIAAHPALCIGAFCPRTGEALASLFLKPFSKAQLHGARTWADCVATDTHRPDGDTGCRDLFGISLSSISADAVDAIFMYFWPRALKAGWRQIYLGSPVPRLARWLEGQPGPRVSVESYVHARRRGAPQDPQLRYYWRKGFRTIVACRPDYFPHAASLDHGVILRGRIPLSALAPVWRHVPLRWLQGMGRWLAVVL